MQQNEPERRTELALVGDLSENESDITQLLLDLEPGGECTIYFDSPGGSPYSALSLMSIIRLRGLQITGVVTGECSSAALWPFAACQRRLVTPFSVMLFHPMRWQSEEHVGLAEASEWARHFGQLEKDMDLLLAELFGVKPQQLDGWINPGRYVTGREVARAGLAELIDVQVGAHQPPTSHVKATTTIGKKQPAADENGSPRKSSRAKSGELETRP